jgi:hypothetical protein
MQRLGGGAEAMALTTTRRPGPEATTGPTNASRIKGFVKYFNSYVASIFVAAIPAPLSQWKLVPILDEQRGLLSIATPIFCFLTLAYLFFMRDALAGPMFPLHARHGRFVQTLGVSPGLAYQLSAVWRRLWGLVPLACICGSFYMASEYYFRYWAVHSMTNLEEAQAEVITPLPLYYILAFVLAEAAFVWMALKEYLQDVLGLSDKELIQDTTPAPPSDLPTPMSDSQPAA